jgi:hypothetical protein
MKRLVLFVVALVFAFCVSAMAAEPVAAPAEKAVPVKVEKVKKAPSAEQLAQQEKMKSCNAEAKTKALKGDEHKKFMSECLKGKPAEVSPAHHSQQDKMKFCNKEASAKALKGDERKKFMSECLKK